MVWFCKYFFLYTFNMYLISAFDPIIKKLNEYIYIRMKEYLSLPNFV